jgi:NhaP-type Na+/H+ or K+/H+ antiporter
MEFTLAFIVIGLLLVGLAMTGTVVERLPLSTGIIYVAVGALLGPFALGLISLDPLEDSAVLERVAEIAVIISLFTAGLKLRLPLRDDRWMLSVRLAAVSMVVTVGLVAAIAYVGLGLPLGVAILLGAILAPTDPVLAGDVRVREAGDRDRVRFSLTSEAGLNDGTAFPFVMLGLGIIGLHEIGDWGWRWVAIDLLWAVPAGLGVGAMLGTLVGRLVIYLRHTRKEAVGLDDFLALGLIALAYGCALAISSYGFLAVFAAGLAVRRIEASFSRDAVPKDVRSAAAMGNPEVATHPETAPAYMTEAVLAFNEQIDRIGAMAIMLLVGAMLSSQYLHSEALWFVPLLLCVVRPLSVRIGLLGTRTNAHQRNLIGWFGVRGVGSIYYLMFAIEHDLPRGYAQELVAMTLSVIATSLVVHGISVSPLMAWYERHIDVRHRRMADPARG